MEKKDKNINNNYKKATSPDPIKRTLKFTLDDKAYAKKN